MYNVPLFLEWRFTEWNELSAALAERLVTTDWLLVLVDRLDLSGVYSHT